MDTTDTRPTIDPDELAEQLLLAVPDETIEAWLRARDLRGPVWRDLVARYGSPRAAVAVLLASA